MLFNSIQFMFFLPAVAVLYYLLPYKYRNTMLLIASYIFYMGWKPQYALLMLLSTFVTWAAAGIISKSSSKKVRVYALAANLVINLGILFFYKYFNFFNDIVAYITTRLGLTYTFGGLDIVLVMGISFYTFQALGYSIDVYRGEVAHEKNFFTYALFVSFFPQLVAGPIERSSNLLPQFYEKHDPNYSTITDGLRQMAIGFFKKIAIADILALYVSAIYGGPLNPGVIFNYTGLTLIGAALMFVVQIYCDFSGYSDIAIGCAKVLGFRLMENFRTPLFATSVTDFWARWHISLSTWFRDYVYLPLGGNRKGYRRTLINFFIIFLLSGLWHGAAITYVIWGALNGVFRVLEAVLDKRRKQKGLARSTKYSGIKNIYAVGVFTVGLVLFRANNISEGIYALTHWFSGLSFQTFAKDIYNIVAAGFNPSNILIYFYIAFTVLMVAVLFVMDWYRCFKMDNALLSSALGSQKTAVRWAAYYAIVGVIMLAFIIQNGGFGSTAGFIYFQF